MQTAGQDKANLNFRLGVYNGILVNGAEAFFHTNLVLAPFLATLGAPAIVIGFIPALRIGSWFLPQLFVASRLSHEPLKLPWYRRSALVRIVAYAIMVATIFIFPERLNLIMIVVLCAIGVVSIAAGISGIPFADVTAKVVPHYRLGTYWALRNTIGGVLALGAGLLLRRLLSGDVPFPLNFGYIFTAGAVLSGAAYLMFCLIREPAGKPTTKQPLRSMVRQVPSLLKENPSFRRYVRVRFLALLAVLADPFYAIYALRVLEAPATSLGLFVILSTTASIAANLLFRRPANRGQNVTVLQIGIALLLSASVCAFFAPRWELFSLVFMLSAAGQAGMGIAAWNLLYAVSPEAQRPLYVGAANSLLFLPSFAPIFAGGLVDLLGFRPTFVLAAMIAATALSFAFRFRELKALDARALRATD